MFRREIETELKVLAKDYPVVTVTGSRQWGKTTLVQHAFPDKVYVNSTQVLNYRRATQALLES
jgi:predicted AAA+ superfamily ATPase